MVQLFTQKKVFTKMTKFLKFVSRKQLGQQRQMMKFYKRTPYSFRRQLTQRHRRQKKNLAELLAAYNSKHGKPLKDARQKTWQQLLFLKLQKRRLFLTQLAKKVYPKTQYCSLTFTLHKVQYGGLKQTVQQIPHHM